MIKTLATMPSRRAAVVGLGALLVGYYAAFGARVNAGEEARLIPPYKPDAQAAPAQGSEEVAVLAGGCFWGVQGVFQHVKGVTSAVSGPLTQKTSGWETRRSWSRQRRVIAIFRRAAA